MLDVKVDFVGNLGAFASGRSLPKEQETGGQDDHQRDENSLDVSHFKNHRCEGLGDTKDEEVRCPSARLRRTDGSNNES